MAWIRISLSSSRIAYPCSRPPWKTPLPWLTLAALRLGATCAIAVDHDLQALEATRANAKHNAVADRLFSYLPEKMSETPVDLLLANILAGPLLELAALRA